MKYSKLLMMSCLLFMAQAIAQDDVEEEFDAVPEPPALPDPLVSGQAIEPEVVIIRRGEDRIEEYRINGLLYMVKITPAVGKPYYLIDKNGDGSLESRILEDYEKLNVPQWVLFRW